MFLSFNLRVFQPSYFCTCSGRIDNFMVAYFTGRTKTHTYDVLTVYSYIILAVSLLNISIVQFATRTYLNKQLKKHNSTEVGCNPLTVNFKEAISLVKLIIFSFFICIGNIYCNFYCKDA